MESLRDSAATMAPRTPLTRLQLPPLDTTFSAATTSTRPQRHSISSVLSVAVALVLGLSAHEVQPVDSFSDLGGNASLATALRLRLLNQGLSVTSEDILRCHTLAELSTCITPLQMPSPLTAASSAFPRTALDEEEQGSEVANDMACSPVEEADEEADEGARDVEPEHDDELDAYYLRANDEGDEGDEGDGDVSNQLHASQRAAESELQMLLQPAVSRAAAVLLPGSGQIVAFLTLTALSGDERRDNGVGLVRQALAPFARGLVQGVRGAVEEALRGDAGKDRPQQEAQGEELAPHVEASVPAVYVVLEGMPLTEEDGPSEMANGGGVPDRAKLSAWIEAALERGDRSTWSRIRAVDAACALVDAPQSMATMATATQQQQQQQQDEPDAATTSTLSLQPSTSTEHAVQRAASRVLRLPRDRVALNLSLSQLGGDSLAASRLAERLRSGKGARESRGRASGFDVRAADVLGANSLAALAEVADSRPGLVVFRERNPAREELDAAAFLAVPPLHLTKRDSSDSGHRSRSSWNSVSSTGSNSSAGLTTQHFELSPMQRLYFGSPLGSCHSDGAKKSGAGSHRFNQSILLRLSTPSPTPVDEVRAAIEAVVGHHAMLRARFACDSNTGRWTQYTLRRADDSFGFSSHVVRSNADVFAAIARAQDEIDLVDGPVFGAVNFEAVDGDATGAGSQQLLFLVAHHLVVDLSSWRVIVHDLDELLSTGCLLSERAVSFMRWGEMLREECDRYLAVNPRRPQIEQAGNVTSDLAYWGLDATDTKNNTYGAAMSADFSLSAELTSLLQTTCNAVFRTESADIYLAALVLSFARAFPEYPGGVPAVWNQDHGRSTAAFSKISKNDVADAAENTKVNLDVEDTVGWFTTLSPVTAGQDVDGGSDLMEVLRRIKDGRRMAASGAAADDRGLLEFSSRFYGGGEFAAPSAWPPTILFNYAGSLPQLVDREGGVLEQLALPVPAAAATCTSSGSPSNPNPNPLVSATSDIGPSVGRVALFEVSALVDAEGRAQVRFVWPEAVSRHGSRHAAKLRDWVVGYEHLLLEAIGRLRYRGEELTLCDVPLLAETAVVGYEGLDKLGNRLRALVGNVRKDVEAVWPTTPLQHEALVEEAAAVAADGQVACANPAGNVVHAVYSFAFATGEAVDVARLCNAWQAVVARHASLRTVLVDSVRSYTGQDDVTPPLWDAVVLRKCSPTMLFIDASSPAQSAVEALSALPALPTTPGQPRHRLTVCRETPSTQAGRPTTPTGGVYLALDISRALCDVPSTAALFRDLRRAYMTAAPHASLSPGSPALVFPAAHVNAFDHAEHIRAQLDAGRRVEAVNFWRAQLEQAEPCLFPRLLDDGQPKAARFTASHASSTPSLVASLDVFCRLHPGTTPDAVLQLGWALVLKAYSGADHDALFGWVDAAREDEFSMTKAAKKDATQAPVGCFATTVPVRVGLEATTTVAGALASLAAQQQQQQQHLLAATAITPAELHHALGVTRRFNTRLSLNDERPAARRHRTHPVALRCLDERDAAGVSGLTFDLAVHARIDATTLRCELASSTVCAEQLRHVAAALEKAVAGIVAAGAEGTELADISLLADEHLAQLLTWSGDDTPEPAAETLTGLLRKSVSSTPDAPALCCGTAEKDSSHWELDVLSGKLATYLRASGVGGGSVIPVVMHKSRWAAVAMVAVLRSGGVVLPLDADDYEHETNNGPTTSSAVMSADALVEMARKSAGVVVTSSERAARRLETVATRRRRHIRILVVGEKFVAALPPVASPRLFPDVKPLDPAFIFANRRSGNAVSGSVYTHGALARVLPAVAKSLGMSRTTRAFQSASFASPRFLAELFGALSVGGAACLPSTQERIGDFAGAARRMGADWLAMPSGLLARKTDPDAVAGTVKTVVFDALDADVDAETARGWRAAGSTTRSVLMAAAPAAESAPLGISVAELIDDGVNNRPTITKPGAGHFYVCSPVPVNSAPGFPTECRLLPVGALGELAISGPSVAGAWAWTLPAVGEEGQSVLMVPPPMGIVGSSPTPTPVARTGKLARHVDTTGGIRMVPSAGPKFAEMEALARRALGPGIEVVVEKISAATSSEDVSPRTILAAFVELGPELFDGGDGPDDLSKLSDQTKQRVALAAKLVRATLAGSGLPYVDAFVPLGRMPVTTRRLRADRRRLAKLAGRVRADELVAVAESSVDANTTKRNSRPSLTRLEARVAALWATVLGADAESIGASDRFMTLRGADSIAAARAVVACRSSGFPLSLSALLADGTLAETCRRLGARAHALSDGAQHGKQGKHVRLQLHPALAAESPSATPTSATPTATTTTATTMGPKPLPPTPPATPPSKSIQPKSALSLRSILPLSLPVFAAPNLAGVDAAQIKSVAPCSATQLAALEGVLLQCRAGLSYVALQFSAPNQASSLDYRRLREACSALSTLHPILRTSFVISAAHRTAYQVVLRSDAGLPEFRRYLCPRRRLDALAHKLAKRDRAALASGPAQQPTPVRFFLLDSAGSGTPGGDDGSDVVATLVVRMVRGLHFDDASLPLLAADLAGLYVGRSPVRESFSTLELLRREAMLGASAGAGVGSAANYYRALLSGARMTTIVKHALPPRLCDAPASARLDRPRLLLPSSPGSLLAAASNVGIDRPEEAILRASWAVTLAELAGSADVVFGAVVSGRDQNALPKAARRSLDANTVLGPAATTVPVRAKFLGAETTALQLVERLHEQHTSGAKFAALGLAGIVEQATDWPYWAQFGSVVEHRGRALLREEAQLEAGVEFGGVVCKLAAFAPGSAPRLQFAHDLHVLSEERDGEDADNATTVHLGLSLHFDPLRVPAAFADEALRRLCANVSLLACASPMQPVVPSAAELTSHHAVIPLATPPPAHVVPLAPLDTTEPTPATSPPRVRHDLEALAAGRLPAALSHTLQSLVATAWRRAGIDLASLGVPDAHRQTAALHDLWGHPALAAAAVAQALADEAAYKQGLVRGSTSAVAIEDILARPTMALQLGMLAARGWGGGFGALAQVHVHVQEDQSPQKGRKQPRKELINSASTAANNSAPRRKPTVAVAALTSQLGRSIRRLATTASSHAHAHANAQRSVSGASNTSSNYSRGSDGSNTTNTSAATSSSYNNANDGNALVSPLTPPMPPAALATVWEAHMSSATMSGGADGRLHMQTPRDANPPPSRGTTPESMTTGSSASDAEETPEEAARHAQVHGREKKQQQLDDGTLLSTPRQLAQWQEWQYQQQHRQEQERYFSLQHQHQHQFNVAPSANRLVSPLSPPTSRFSVRTARGGAPPAVAVDTNVPHVAAVATSPSPSTPPVRVADAHVVKRRPSKLIAVGLVSPA